MTPRIEHSSAVLIGIERYRFDPKGGLDGPALDACRMATLLLKHGMPPGRITVLVSPLDRNREDVLATAAGVSVREVDGNGIYAFLEKDLSRDSGDALVFWWAGHGFDHEDDQWVYLPEARRGAAHSLNVTGHLLPTLRGAGYRFPEQMVFIDACRTSFREFEPELQPVPRRLPGAATGGCHRQQILLAAPKTAVALSDPGRRTSRFSTAVREAVSGEAASGEAASGETAWPWDFEVIHERISQHPDRPGSLPVRCLVRSPDGGSREINSDDIVSLRAVADLLDVLPGMRDPGRMSLVVDLIEEAEDFRVRFDRNDTKTAHGVVRQLARSRFGLRPLERIMSERPDLFHDRRASELGTLLRQWRGGESL